MNPALALIAISGTGEQPAPPPEWLRRVGGPLGFAGRVIGLGEAEMRAGVPPWAWALGGLVLGASAMYVLSPRIRAAVGGYTV